MFNFKTRSGFFKIKPRSGRLISVLFELHRVSKQDTRTYTHRYFKIILKNTKYIKLKSLVNSREWSMM